MRDETFLWFLAGLLVVAISVAVWRLIVMIRRPTDEAHLTSTLEAPRNQRRPRSPAPEAPTARQQRPAASPPPQPSPGDSATPLTPGGSRIVTRTTDRHGQTPLIDDYAELGEQLFSVSEAAEIRRLYLSGLTVREVALRSQQDQKQVAIHLVRAFFDHVDPIDDDDAQPRARKAYSKAELKSVAAMFEAGAGLPHIARAVGRSQLGVGWRMLDQGLPRRT